MSLEYKDLASIQETRQLISKAKTAQLELAKKSQEEIDTIVKVLSKAAYSNREKLAKMACEETGFGKWEDKIIKNAFASKTVTEAMDGMQTIGIINEDKEKKVTEVAVPKGVIAGLVPSTNPTSTVIYKALISLKTANSIVFSPHPSAKKSIQETVRIMVEAGKEVGLPDGAISVIDNITMDGTNELMTNNDTNLILATGGSAMVKAAYSSGTPAIGVGPGNGPAFIEKSANVSLAVKQIIESKTFDYGTVCASEQSVIVEKNNKDKVVNELKKQGAYFLPKEDASKLEKYILRPDGRMNPAIVGKSPQHIADLAGIKVPTTAKVLIAEESRVGLHAPYSREKLGTILAFYTVDSWQDALKLSIEILNQEGAGHTMGLHSYDEAIIKEFSLHAPVSRLLINTSATLGGIGATTNIFPALTLGCGSVGGSSTSDNIGPANLMDIRRVAWGVRELDDIKREENIVTNNKLDKEFNFDENQLLDLLVEKVLEKLK
ncbi:acetaldehyde dehydrogenase (acetylating) [Fundicoccus culcitae]|uniref:Acetaldehyde dehydrogenase (Acetylating) n=1 Tax=Fundicoccus culcitae TaxID=2969821 RepID=A0ABY5P4M6_9LACT|nr:acetaldehyde dehydrogenase (acetylating) [Fundicoccus culcitae]UUX33330.1 acetaldehyde dehydrogenase (acetylating) [Fundicoccus culcitae]